MRQNNEFYGLTSLRSVAQAPFVFLPVFSTAGAELFVCHSEEFPEES